MNEDVKAYIVDVDGTLYSLRKMRFIMACQLIGHALRRPHNARDLVILKRFRKKRELARYSGMDVETICGDLAEQYDLDPKEIEETVQRWMFQAPLKYLEKCKYPDFISWLKKERSSGKLIIIYSDYEAEGKLEALGVEYDHVFISDETGKMKPDKTAMETILKKTGMASRQCVFIGDRDDVDGMSAQSVGMRYVNIGKWLSDNKAR